MAATQATKEAIWLQRLMLELGFKQEDLIVIYKDNKGALDLLKNPVHYDHTKHIDIQWHFVQEKVESGEVTLHQCCTSEQLADVLTKTTCQGKILGRCHWSWDEKYPMKVPLLWATNFFSMCACFNPGGVHCTLVKKCSVGCVFFVGVNGWCVCPTAC